MRTLAILPIKSFAEAKRRLETELAPGRRRALAEAMFSDVLVALRRSPLDGILVVSADHAAQRIAGGHGAEVLDDDQSGHNPAAARGIRYARESGFERALLVPGDCPLLGSNDVDRLLARDAQGVTIVPDRHRTGTNALLLTPPDSIEPGFGPGSCARHVETARAGGIKAEVLNVPSLALDVDTPDDLRALEAALADTHGGAAHTRGMLRQLSRSR